MDVGEEWIYRARYSAPSQRVRIRSVNRSKRSVRVVVEWLDGDQSGHVEDVPAGRLRGLWEDVTAFDELMANWNRIDGYDLDSTEERAAMVVFEQLVPEDTATFDMGNVRNCVGVQDAPELERITSRRMGQFTSQVTAFEDGGTWWLSAEGALLVAEAACRNNPIPILEWISTEEQRCREACKRGAPRTGLDGESYTSSPDWEYQWYRRHEMPLHEDRKSVV